MYAWLSIAALLFVLPGCEAVQAGPCGLTDSCAQDESLDTTVPVEMSVRGKPVATCSTDPMTGFFRDGTCRTGPSDRGIHTVCAEVDDRFLDFTASRGNDLRTPSTRSRFPGLVAGDRWCLCAARWLEAHEHDMAPKVYLRATHQRALEIVPLESLKRFALDLN